MSVEENIALARRFLEAQVKGDLEAMDEMITPDFVGHTRLQALVAGHGEERALGDLLMEELSSFVGQGWEQEDDIILLTLERSASRR